MFTIYYLIGYTILFWVAHWGQTGDVEAMLHEGADVNYQNYEGGKYYILICVMNV